MKLNARIAAVEKRLKPEQFGWKLFKQADDNENEFYDVTYGSDHTGQRRYTRAEIEALERAGWSCLEIVRDENWRARPDVLAVVQPGMVEKYVTSMQAPTAN